MKIVDKLVEAIMKCPTPILRVFEGDHPCYSKELLRVVHNNSTAECIFIQCHHRSLIIPYRSKVFHSEIILRDVKKRLESMPEFWYILDELERIEKL